MPTAVMRHVRSTPINPPDPPADLMAAMRAATTEQLAEAATLIEESPPMNPAEKAALIRGLIARLRAPRFAADRVTVHPAKPAPPATRTCSTPTKEKPVKTATAPNTAPPPPDMLEMIHKLRGTTTPLPDPYKIGEPKAAPAGRADAVPPPPSVAAEIRRQRALAAGHNPYRIGGAA